MIIVLWRARLRVQEALTLTEHDLGPRRGSLLVGSGKGGRRREAGMEAWGWEQLRPWLSARAELPVGPLFCIIEGPTHGRPRAPVVVDRRGARPASPHRRERGCPASVRAASVAPRARA
jgi:hypothetical protein